MNRLKELRVANGYKTQADLAKTIFVNQTAVSQWERGVTTPSPDMLVKLANLYGVTVDYILNNRDDTIPNDLRRVPVLGEVAAGLPMMAEENIVDYEEIDPAMATSGELFGLRIKGSSMEPRIKEGDVVIVRKQEDVDTGDVAVVLVNGDSATVKRFRRSQKNIYLIPENEDYAPIHLTTDDFESGDARILGIAQEVKIKL